MRIPLRAVGMMSVLIGMAGCRSTQSILSEYERDITSGQYAAAEACVAERARESGDNQLLWQLHASSAAALQNKYQDSIEWSDRAEQRCQQNDTTSVFAQGMSHGVAFLANDMYYPYDANGHERVFNGLSKAKYYAALGQIQPARTEFNRTLDWQDNYLFERKKQVAAAEENFQKNGGNGDDRSQQISSAIMGNAQFKQQVNSAVGEPVTQPINLETLSKADYVNAYALHLAGVFRWINGDGGRVHLQRASELAVNNAAVRQDAQEVAKGGKPAGIVWVYFEDGLCPRRDQIRIDFPIFLSFHPSSAIYVGMAFPKLYERPAGAMAYTATSNGQTYPAAMLQDMDRLIKTEYRLWFRGALTREIARATVKVGSQIALEIVKQNDRDHALYYDLGKLLAIGWTASTVGADIRSWTALPKAVYCCRVPKPASGKISVASGAENLEISIPTCNTAIVWIRKTSAAAPSVVTVAAFQ